MLEVDDAAVQASAAGCLAALSIEVASKVPVVAAAAPALIKLAQQEANKVRRVGFIWTEVLTSRHQVCIANMCAV
jgi:hypothetical protein